MKKQIDYRIVVTTRILLFLSGSSVGWIAMWQLFLAYPALVPDGLKIAFDAAAALFLGGLLALSARPILNFAVYLGGAIARFVSGHKPIEIVGVFLGLAAGLMIAFFANVVMGLFVKISAVRVVLTVVIGIVACFFGALAFVRLLLSPPETEQIVPTGYILHSTAFLSPKLTVVIEEWLTGAVFVSSKTVAKLIAGVETDSEPLVKYRRLLADDAVRLIESANKLTEDEDTVRLARLKRLKLIVSGADELPNFGPGVKVLDIGCL